MITIYNEILLAKSEAKRLLAILIDPDKVLMESISNLIAKINLSPATHIFVGGSSFEGAHLDELIVELKSIEKLLPIHEAQLLTYLRLSSFKTGILLNFNVPILKDGLKRMKL